VKLRAHTPRRLARRGPQQAPDYRIKISAPGNSRCAARLCTQKEPHRPKLGLLAPVIDDTPSVRAGGCDAILALDTGARHGDLGLSERARQCARTMTVPGADDGRGVIDTSGRLPPSIAGA
jgi:hypothetical protein